MENIIYDKKIDTHIKEVEYRINETPITDYDKIFNQGKLDALKELSKLNNVTIETIKAKEKEVEDEYCDDENYRIGKLVAYSELLEVED